MSTYQRLKKVEFSLVFHLVIGILEVLIIVLVIIILHTLGLSSLRVVNLLAARALGQNDARVDLL
jgi:hypothetical protein